MPSIDLFEPRDEAAIRLLLSAARSDPHSVASRETFAIAVDYLEGRQLIDVETELNARYERTQSGDRGSRIAAQVIPLTARYVDEAATAYTKPVVRTLVRPDGEPDEENTAALQAMLADAGFDDAMSRLEQYTVLLKSAGLWMQARGGALRPQVVWPHLITPVLPDDDWSSVSDQNDYAGHVIELFTAGGGSKQRMRYAWCEPAQVAFYSGVDPYTPDSEGITRHESAFRWPQTVDAQGISGTTSMLPLQMLTIAHDRAPVGELIIDNDPAVVLANRELNLQLSILLDTLAHQGWATLLVNLLNPDSPPSMFSAGPRNGLALGAGESASMLTSPVNYTDLMTVLQTWVRMLAMTMSQSPNDFSAQAQAAASGFAKLVDSLPKVESRRRRIERWRTFERRIAWPRIAVIGDALGLLTGGVEYLAGLTLSAEYQPLEFPESVPERVARETHELDRGLTTPAKVLAKRSGKSLEEAEAEVAENLGEAEDEETEADGAEPRPDEPDIQRTALNGAQVTSMQGIVMAAAAGELPRDSAVAIIEVAFQLSAADADRIVGDAGKQPISPALKEASTQQKPPASPPLPQREPTPGEAIGQLIRGRNRR